VEIGYHNRVTCVHCIVPCE